MRRVITVTLFGILPFLAGCTYNIPYPTSMNFDPQSMVYVGQVYAETEQDFLFCSIPINTREALPLKLASGLRSVGADAAINVFAEKESGVFLGLYCWETIRISGTAIKFKPSVKLAQALPGGAESPSGTACPAGQHFDHGQCRLIPGE